MLRKKALRKIFVTTLSAFVLLVVYIVPGLEKEEVLETNLEVEYITGMGTNNIYLLDENDLLVKTKIILDGTKKENQVKQIIKNLTNHDNQKYPDGLKSYISEDVKVLDITSENDIININFSKEFLDIKENLEKRVIEGISYSVLDIEGVKGVRILVENENLLEYPNCKEKIPAIITKDIGINKRYDISSRKNVNKVVVYYLENIDSNNYYVPVTKYLNGEKEKIEVIVEELTSKYIYEDNLMSLVNSNLELLNYEEKENMMLLDFNNYLFDQGNKVLEEVLYTLSYSVFDNYSVNCILFRVDGKIIDEVSLKDLI